MFLLCNVHDRNYAEVYRDSDVSDIRTDIRFDISDAQLRNIKNAAWEEIEPGAIICVVKSSRKISTFCRVEEKLTTDVSDDEGGFQNIVTGAVIAKLKPAQDMSSWLTQSGVKHKYMPSNKFSVGFNVANLGNSADAAILHTHSGRSTLGELEGNTSA